MTGVCIHCGEALTFEHGKGWLHPDGKLIKQRLVKTHKHPSGILVDDHIATPNCSVNHSKEEK
jgi:hypothetical protein